MSYIPLTKRFSVILLAPLVRAAEGTAYLTIQVADDGNALQDRFTLSIKPALQLSNDVFRAGPDKVRLMAIHGAQGEDADKPYSWQVVGGMALLAGVLLDADHGTVAIKGKPDGPSTSRINATPSALTEDTQHRFSAMR